ncbi:crossover junction endodeoxyribonuclease RuvC [Candidatus Giovannonibacteria bacterium]|nr:crossover junction endodeoxyribonuclease RuvC [Candidatus Giovannonibacteria bacterium]
MKVLGIDPGIERLGWAILKKNEGNIERMSSGVKRTLKTQPTPERLFEIYDFLEKLIQKENPDMISVEKLFFAKNLKTASVIGEVRGAILTASQKYKAVIREFTPLEVKMAVCGYGRADKKDVASMLGYSIKMPTEKLLDDETDAIALALTALVHTGYPHQYLPS